MTRLSETQARILQFIADGYNSYEIAAMLHLSRDTVKSYTKVLYQKLNASDRANAVAIGFREGILK